MLNRRGFFSTLAAVAATAALDPERLLWIPGKRLISIPEPVFHGWATPEFFSLGDIITFDRDPTRYVVTAAGRSFDDIRFRYADRDAALVCPLPTANLHHSRLATAGATRPPL